MTKDDLLERAAFWQVGLMDVDHLRDVAYEALDSPFDCTEFRLIAGDARLSTDDARELLERAFRGAGLQLPTQEQAERMVTVSMARSILSGTIDPLWGAGYFSNLISVEKGLPVEARGPLVYYSCECCNGLDEMVDPKLRAERRAECRTEIRDHLRKVLPEIEAWAGTPGRCPSGGEAEAGFLGWRRPLESERSELRNLDRKIAGVLLRIWDPIGVSHEKQAKDEYDCCIPFVQRILLTDAPEADLADQLRDYLRKQEVEHMEVQDLESSARRREVAIQELLSLRA